MLVPLNFRLSADEVTWALADADAKLVVAGAAFAPVVAPSGRRLIVIDDGVEPAHRRGLRRVARGRG